MSHTALATRAALVATATAATLVTALPAPIAPPAAPDVPVLAALHVLAPAGPSVDAAPVDAAPDPAVAARASAVRFALSKVGRPYRYGASGPNAFDCSGLVQWTYKQLGVSLPRTSRAQSQAGRPVSQAELQPGDLVFFHRPVSHVGIYIGDGKIVHASTSGSPVKISSMAGRTYHSARRI